MKLQTVHLFGGPLDGHADPEIPEHCHALQFQGLQGSYTYCPHASAHFDHVTFIHSTLEHDLFHPSLSQ